MKGHKKIITVIIILVVAFLMYAAFYGIKLKKKENGERTNILPDIKLGMEFGKTRVITAEVDETVTEKIYDSEGNLVIEPEEGVEYTEEAGYKTEQEKTNDDSVKTLANYKKSKAIIEKKLKQYGVSEFFIDLNKENGKMTIQIPQNEKTDVIEDLIQRPGNFMILDSETYDTLMDDNMFKKANVVYTQGNAGTYILLQLEFNKEGEEKLQELSKIYTTTTIIQNNEEGEPEEVTTTKKVGVAINNIYLGTTEITNILSDNKLILNYGYSSDPTELQTYLEEAQESAILLNSEKLPIVYNFSDEVKESKITTEEIYMFAIVIGFVFLVAYIYLVVRFTAKGFISIYFQIGFFGILVLILKLTSVILTIEGMAGIVISMILDYIFTFIVLNNIEKEEDGMYKLSNLQFFLNTLPIYAISVIFTFAKRAHISSFGMTLFWGIIIIYIYNFIFSKFVFENMDRRVKNENK